MPESIRIGGGVRLTINDDPNRVISFDPSDLSFAERVYDLVTDLEKKEVEYRRQAEELDAAGGDFKAGMALIREVCEDMKTRIDSIFGDGTSKAAFGDACTVTMFDQFFDGVMPYIAAVRKPKMDKYKAMGKGGSGAVLRK